MHTSPESRLAPETAQVSDEQTDLGHEHFLNEVARAYNQTIADEVRADFPASVGHGYSPVSSLARVLARHSEPARPSMPFNSVTLPLTFDPAKRRLP
jgi:hypothetical protein